MKHKVIITTTITHNNVNFTQTIPKVICGDVTQYMEHFIRGVAKAQKARNHKGETVNLKYKIVGTIK